MPRDANGNYTLPSGNPVVSGEVISTTWANPTMADLAVEMTSSLDRNGKGGMLAPFKFLDGNEGAPGLTFTADPSMGIYRAGVKDMRASVGGDKMRWTDTGVDVTPDQGTTWYPLITDGDPGLPFLPLAGGSLTGSVTFLGGTDLQFNGGGQTVWLGPTNAASNTIYNDDGGAIHDTSAVAIPHVFRTGAVQRLLINDASASFTTPVSVNEGRTLTLWNPAMNGFNQMFCGATEADYLAGGTVASHNWFTGGVQRAALNASGYTVQLDSGDGPILMLRNRAVNGSVHKFGSLIFAPYRDIADPNYGAAIWAAGTSPAGNTIALYLGAQSNLGTATYPLAAMQINTDAVNVMWQVPFVMYNGDNSIGRGFRIGPANELVMMDQTGANRGGVYHAVDPVNVNGGVSISTAAASGTPGVNANGALWLQYTP